MTPPPIAQPAAFAAVSAASGSASEPVLRQADGQAEGEPPDAKSYLAMSVAHLDAGDPRAALVAASEALHRDATLVQAHYAYGQAWAALGRHAQAEQAFAGALQLDNGWADAWVNFGVARYRQGAVEDAKTAMRQALARAPEHKAARANLAVFLRLTGEGEAAEGLLRSVVAADPADAGARLNLVADLLQEDRCAEALTLLDDAEVIPADPGAARHWHLQRSLALLQLRRTGEARAALDALAALGPVPAALAPLLHWRHVLLAVAEGDAAAARAAACEMEAALVAMGPGATPEHRIMAHYDLAKFWSGQNAHPRAFGHWVKGHEALGRSQPFSRDQHAAIIGANVSHFDAARFAAGRVAHDADPAPVFIVGMPRSGTTLCEQILAAHRDVHGAGERAALDQAATILGRGPGSPDAVRRVAALDVPALDAAAGSYLAALHALAPDKARVVDKMPGNYLHLGLVGLMLPGARIIHCVRDPRDIGLSIFTHRFYGHHAYAHDLGDLGWTIAQQSRLMAHWRAVLPNPILTVRLSDWVEDFDGTLDRVLAFLDLPPDPNCARFHEGESRVRTVSRAQVRQPINARGLGRWRIYETELAPLTAELEAAGALAGW